MRSAGWIAGPLFLLAAIVLSSCVYSHARLSGRATAEQITQGHAPAAAVAASNPAGRATRLSFALVRGGGEPILAWGPDDDIHLDAAALARGGIEGRFLFILRDGVAHVLTDPVLLTPLAQTWGEIEQQDARIGAMDAQLQLEYTRSAELSAQLQQISAKQSSAGRSSEARALTEQLRRADQRLRDLSAEVRRQHIEQDVSARLIERLLHGLHEQAVAINLT